MSLADFGVGEKKQEPIRLQEVVAKKEYDSNYLGGAEGNYDQISKEEGLDLVDIQLIKEVTLEEEYVYVSVSYSEEMPNHFLGGSWGGGGRTELSEVKNLLQELMERKKENLKKPYRKFADGKCREVDSNHEYYYYRLVPAKNFFVKISKNLVEYLETEEKFNWELWYDEYKKLPENEATQETISKVNTLMCFLEDGEAMTKYAHEIKERIKRILEGKKIQESLNPSEESVDNLLLALNQKRNELIKIDEQIKTIKKDINYGSESGEFESEIYSIIRFGF